MEVVQEVLEQVSTRLLTESDLDSSFSFLRTSPASPLASTNSIPTPLREVLLMDRQEDEEDLLSQSNKSIPSTKSSTESTNSSSTCHHMENLQNIITTMNCSLSNEVGKVQDQLRNHLITTMSSQVQGLRTVVMQQGGKIKQLKSDSRCNDSYTRFGRRPYSRSYSRSRIPQTPMKKR
ncbi:unnamed protein product [Mytilus coruscus]|uniref:Uncharacterized protein n=1 Tax=Mytilus coruscus TaxID=42192 RepID=A0A6J8C834_MYTCO|nr:unnamed protein product [Mytilus coruscus]